MIRTLLLLVLVIQAQALTSLAALPKRLVLAVDGICYRDIQALQQGLTCKDTKGREVHRQAFTNGYFPASRIISTFPSTSDVAWSDIFGNRPLPGYQRTYFSHAMNSVVAVNGVTTSMEHERQMHWDLTSGFFRSMGYVYPNRIFKRELRDLAKSFLSTTNDTETYYAYIRSTDDAQHMSGDILAMMCELDEKLQDLRVRYQAREGRELEILILSDHGNNHASASRRVQVRTFLKQAGYRLSQSLVNPKDVVLPTAGMESWVEIHNWPSETERLMQQLWHLKGVDILTAQAPGQSNRFIVMNGKGERAVIDWNTASDSFRYSIETGDPLDYASVLVALRARNQLDNEGFASAEAWMTETMYHRYPLALERIARGHTRVTLNPATILISLQNGFVHASWLVMTGSELVKLSGTHGAIDDLNSDGVLLSNFASTQDTSTDRVAALFDGFPGRRDFRAHERGAEWVTGKEQVQTRDVRSPMDQDCEPLPADGVFLRVWTPEFSCSGSNTPIEVKVQPRWRSPQPRSGHGNTQPAKVNEQRLTLTSAITPTGHAPYERFYWLSAELKLEPRIEYRISGWLRDPEHTRIFSFLFHADSHGLPVAY